MNTEYHNPKDYDDYEDSYMKDFSGCLIMFAALFVTAVSAAAIILFSR